MPAQSITLKPSEILFKEGDSSDGMYIVRKGELEVYLSKNGKENVLSKIPMGGIIGEMALFDQKPRSASVRSTTGAEVTLISTEDFFKLLTQIPKWFNSLIISISGRLRDTNQRLQNAEEELRSVGGRGSYSILRALFLLDLIWSKYGEKDEKSVWTLDFDNACETLKSQFKENPEFYKRIVDVLSDFKIFSQGANAYKHKTIAQANKGILAKFTTAFDNYLRIEEYDGLSVGGLELLTLIEGVCQQAPYDSVTITIEELLTSNPKHTEDWFTQAQLISRLFPDFKLNTAGASQLQAKMKIEKKNLKEFIHNQKMISALCNATRMK